MQRRPGISRQNPPAISTTARSQYDGDRTTPHNENPAARRVMTEARQPSRLAFRDCSRRPDGFMIAGERNGP
jgi:hypothetical protein